ncbi:hypothetical protein FDK38_002307 [Candidozyma auris]|nr:hypothetical protein FDK38_002307 [[Candida] auris]
MTLKSIKRSVSGWSLNKDLEDQDLTPMDVHFPRANCSDDGSLVEYHSVLSAPHTPRIPKTPKSCSDKFSFNSPESPTITLLEEHQSPVDINRNSAYIPKKRAPVPPKDLVPSIKHQEVKEKKTAKNFPDKKRQKMKNLFRSLTISPGKTLFTQKAMDAIKSSHRRASFAKACKTKAVEGGKRFKKFGHRLISEGEEREKEEQEGGGSKRAFESKISEELKKSSDFEMTQCLPSCEARVSSKYRQSEGTLPTSDSAHSFNKHTSEVSDSRKGHESLHLTKSHFGAPIFLPSVGKQQRSISKPDGYDADESDESTNFSDALSWTEENDLGIEV